MTQKNQNSGNKDMQKSLLRSGLTSEFFILCFIKPDKPYEIAKTIKNVKTLPDVSKLYPARDKLVDYGYLEKKGTSYHPIYSKLTQEIAGFLYEEKNETLDEKEIGLLKYFLKNAKFVRLLHDEITKMIQTQEKRMHNIDSLKFIASLVGAISLLLWSVKHETTKDKEASNQLDVMSNQITAKDLEQFETQWEQFSNILMKNFGDVFTSKITIKNNENNPDEFDGLDKNEMVKMIFSSMPVILLMVDTEFLRKIAKMAEGADAMNVIGIILGSSSTD